MNKEATSGVRIGEDAPSFELMSDAGGKVKLSDFRGRPVVLYFYPRDDTPGCTIEAKEFQARLEDFETAGAVVVGVSPDGIELHCAFAEKHGLEFTLLADVDHEAAKKYGVWVEKNRNGKKSWGIQRATFLVDASGKVAGAWPRVSPEGHAAEVLEAVKALAQSEPVPR